MRELRVTGKTKKSVKRFWNTFSCLGVLLQHCKSSLHIHQGQEQNCFLPQAEIIGISWHFGSFSFLANGISHLVKFGWIFNSDYKNNVLQGSYTFSQRNFQDFSRTFKDQINKNQGPLKLKKKA